jgi:ADP-ribose pyrophosphatase
LAVQSSKTLEQTEYETLPSKTNSQVDTLTEDKIHNSSQKSLKELELNVTQLQEKQFIAKQEKNSERLDTYLELYHKYSEKFGPLGSWKDGEIEIILDKSEIIAIEKAGYERHLAKGLSPQQAKQYSRVGILGQDRFWTFLRDAVIFPNGQKDTFNRVIRTQAIPQLGSTDAIILPILSTTEGKKILLNVTFRHASRSWELELPAGHREANETVEETAKRELEEETGYSVNTVTKLGTTTSHAGILIGYDSTYVALATTKKERHLDETETIADTLAFSKNEIKEGLIQGTIKVHLKGREIFVSCKSYSIAYALLLAEYKGFI